MTREKIIAEMIASMEATIEEMKEVTPEYIHKHPLLVRLLMSRIYGDAASYLKDWNAADEK